MRKLKAMFGAAVMVAAMVLPAGANTRQSAAAAVSTRHQNATMLAKQLRCGGPDLECGPVMVRVCNSKNNKCCCATAGTYH